MLDRVLAILKKEFLQIFRDPRMRMVIFVSPLIQVLVFGYAATMDITHVPIAVYDIDNTKESRALIHDFSYSQYFDIKHYVREESQVNALIDKSRVLAVLKFNAGFSRDLVGNNPAEVQLVVDGTDSNAASIILGYANSIITNYNLRVLYERSQVYLGGEHNLPYVDLRDRRWFNENLESRNYYLPGVIVLIVTIMSLLLSAMAIVREKEIGTMEQLIVSPIRPVELIVGKILPFGVIALVQVTLITLVGVLWFHVPLRGSIPLLFICTILYLLTTLGAGLFLSTMCATQQEAMMSVFLFNFPATLLSGFAYPIANMPQIIQYLTYLNPQRYYLTIVRYIFLKGVGIEVLWDEMLALLVIGVIVITMSSLRFQKRLG
ncbi:MAG: ABC transporter permease [Candidatus Omnitrophica bacterium]|nr:ABC transporter permease [Candidatus Omnitrophota bacterium]